MLFDHVWASCDGKAVCDDVRIGPPLGKLRLGRSPGAVSVPATRPVLVAVQDVDAARVRERDGGGVDTFRMLDDAGKVPCVRWSRGRLTGARYGVGGGGARARQSTAAGALGLFDCGDVLVELVLHLLAEPVDGSAEVGADLMRGGLKIVQSAHARIVPDRRQAGKRRVGINGVSTR